MIIPGPSSDFFARSKPIWSKFFSFFSLTTVFYSILFLLYWILFRDLHCIRNTIHANFMISHLFVGVTWIVTALVQRDESEVSFLQLLWLQWWRRKKFWVEILFFFTLLVLAWRDENFFLLMHCQWKFHSKMFAFSLVFLFSKVFRLECLLYIILIYFNVTTFFWMFIEGLYLYILVLKTFSIERVKKHTYLFIGWGEYYYFHGYYEQR